MSTRVDRSIILTGYTDDDRRWRWEERGGANTIDDQKNIYHVKNIATLNASRIIIIYYNIMNAQKVSDVAAAAAV